jgi:hypothetical protein
MYRRALSIVALAVVPWAIYATLRGEAQKSTRVTLSPVLGMAPLTVQLRAVIDAPSEDWYCPRLEVVWQDSTRSVRESDCPAWPDVPEGYRYSVTIRRTLGPGRHDIVVTLTQGALSREFNVWAEVS